MKGRDPVFDLFCYNLVRNSHLFALISSENNYHVLEKMTPEQRRKLHEDYEKFCKAVDEVKMRGI